MGASAYLVKPVGRRDLLTALANVGDMERRVTSRLVRDVLEFHGYVVLEATSGEDGVDVAQLECPDLILMDLQLPGIDGTQALHLLRETSGTCDIPVVAVTAFAMKDDRDRALLAGFDGYIEKPISVRSLPGQVENFLRRGAP